MKIENHILPRILIIVLSVLLTTFTIFGISQENKRKQLDRKNPNEMTPESIARGKTVFFEYCSGCHGARADGRGPQALNLIPKPQNLRNTPFVNYLSDERMYTSISGGVRGTSMPAFEMIYSANKRWDVMNYVRSLSVDYEFGEIDNSTDFEKVDIEVKNPVPLTEESVAEGKKIYTKYCMSCHGEKIDGKGKVAENLIPRPRNLAVIISWGEVPFMNYLDDSRTYDSITNGVPGTSMSPWLTTLNSTERWNVINYLRAEAKKEKTDFGQSFTEE